LQPPLALVGFAAGIEDDPLGFFPNQGIDDGTLLRRTDIDRYCIERLFDIGNTRPPCRAVDASAV